MLCILLFIPLLQYTELPTDSSIQNFIKSIDHNPKQTYLNAVKVMYIGREEPEILINFPYTRDNIQKLFLRFPNLQNIHIYAHSGSFDDYKEEFCDLVLESCPRLGSFEVHMMEDCTVAQYSEIRHKLQRLLTNIDVDKLDYQSRSETAEEFITNFHRLKSIEGRSHPLSFIRLLPVLEMLPLTRIGMMVAPVSEDDFVERYLESKTTVQRSQLLDRFVNVADLRLCLDQLCERSIRFVSNYLTGLKIFSVCRLRQGDWDDTDMQLFYNDIMVIVTSAKESGNVCVLMTVSTLTTCFPHIANKIYRQMPSTKNRTLTLEMADGSLSTNDKVSLEITHEPNMSTQSIHICSNKSIMECLCLIPNLGPIMNVDVFEVSTSSKRLHEDYDSADELLCNRYDDAFAAMPKLEKAAIIISDKHKETRADHFNYDQVYHGLVHSHLRDLTISAAPDVKFQSMLNEYAFMFPKLEHLTLYYYSGTWEPERGEFSVILPKYSLNSLTIDMTPVKTKTMQYLGSQFFVVELETLNNGKRQLLKVSLDLTSVISIVDSDLQGLVRCEDYFRAHISIGSLERLDLCMGDDTTYSGSNLQPVTCIQ